MSGRSISSILVTGGYGFIGSNFIRFLFASDRFSGRVVNLDALTYAGNPLNLTDIEQRYDDNRYTFIHGDITDSEMVKSVMREYEIDTIVHFAAESHVDRSIYGPAEFIRTNVIGTFTLLEAAREYWHDRDDVLFHHVSTDEVYGSLGDTGFFHEGSPYDPRSPYSASKAGSDHLASAYYHTYGLPVTISNCSNNYGPYQFPEKLIPLMILNMHEGKPLPVYGDGLNVRDWVYVDDHNDGVWRVITGGVNGATYNIGGGNEQRNIDVVRTLCEVYAGVTGEPLENVASLITFVKDRPGHDRRYAIDSSKIRSELGWNHSIVFREGLKATVRWYLEHIEWVDAVRSGEYLSWIERNYEKRV
jgi:dTDP-glucose 4,6-dehydratase